MLTPFLIFVFMVMELSWGRGVQFLVDRATVQTAREMLDVRNTITTYQRFEEEFCRNAGPMLVGCDGDDPDNNNLFVYLVANGNLPNAIDSFLKDCALMQDPAPPDDEDCENLIVDERTGSAFLGSECEGRDPPYSGVCPKCNQPAPDPYIPTAFTDPGLDQFAFVRVCFQATTGGDALVTPLRRLLGTTGGGTAMPTTTTIQSGTGFWNHLLRCTDGTHGNGTCKAP